MTFFFKKSIHHTSPSHVEVMWGHLLIKYRITQEKLQTTRDDMRHDSAFSHVMTNPH